MRRACVTLLVGLVFLFNLGTADAVVFPFGIFTNNGEYNKNPGAIFKVDVTGESGLVNFTFFNESIFDCAIAALYFDDGTLLGVDEIINGPGATFLRDDRGSLPGGNLINPPFVATKEFNIGADNPAPQNGVNAVPSGEWVRIKFNLKNNGTLQNVLDDLHTGALRVGIHVISFPDGKSESAILTPEPATICLLGLGSLLMLRKHKEQKTNF